MKLVQLERKYSKVETEKKILILHKILVTASEVIRFDRPRVFSRLSPLDQQETRLLQKMSRFKLTKKQLKTTFDVHDVSSPVKSTDNSSSFRMHICKWWWLILLLMSLCAVKPAIETSLTTKLSKTAAINTGASSPIRKDKLAAIVDLTFRMGNRVPARLHLA